MVESQRNQYTKSVHYPLTGVRPAGSNSTSFWMVVAGSSVAAAILFVAGVMLSVPV
jgi:hypothetical protein